MITGLAHFGFSVTDLDRTIRFYTEVMGMELISRTQVKGSKLGVALFGKKWGLTQASADIEVAVMRKANIYVEFIQYKEPKAAPYHQDPSVAGSAHMAFRVDDIEVARDKLEKAGVEFHSPVKTVEQDNGVGWKWCYFRDPDGIVLELVGKIQKSR